MKFIFFQALSEADSNLPKAINKYLTNLHLYLKACNTFAVNVFCLLGVLLQDDKFAINCLGFENDLTRREENTFIIHDMIAHWN